MDPRNARKLVEVAKGSRFEAIYTVAITLGLRRGEVLGLRWSDVDLDGRTLRVNQSIQRLLTGADSGPKSSLQATETKTDGSRRTIALPDSVVRALRLQRARQAQQRLAAGLSWDSRHDLIFTNQTGGLLEPGSCSRLQGASKEGRITDDDAISRSSPQRRVTAASAGRSSARDHGATWTQFDNRHDERLRTRDASNDARRGGQDGSDY